MNIIKIILYPSPLAPFFGKEEDLKLRCKLERPYHLFVTFADVCSQLLLANRTRTSSEASPALLLSLLDSHIRSMMS